jgi:hypothetical protein
MIRGLPGPNIYANAIPLRLRHGLNRYPNRQGRQ